MTQPPPRPSTELKSPVETDSNHLPPRDTEDLAARDELTLFTRLRRVTPAYARARNQSFAILGAIVLGGILLVALAAWFWNALGTAG